uniref:Uncharacterized protein n=1 Tax=Oryza brachyantha TaxID=4533 RepID=J3MTV9_ORYBR
MLVRGPFSCVLLSSGLCLPFVFLYWYCHPHVSLLLSCWNSARVWESPSSL